VEQSNMSDFINSIQRLDQIAFDHIRRKSDCRKFGFSMLVISRLGDGFVWIAIAIFLLIYGGSAERLKVFYGFVAAILCILVCKLLKLLIRRQRPAVPEEFRRVVKPWDIFSFPSGHSALSFALALMVAVNYPLYAVPVFLFAALIAFTRVYFGTHYPLDVVAGSMIGLLFAGIILFLTSGL